MILVATTSAFAGGLKQFWPFRSQNDTLPLPANVSGPVKCTCLCVPWIYDWNWAAAENEFRRAIELNPSYAPAHQFYGLYLSSLGRPDEAVSESRRALSLDPLSSELNGFLGQVLERTRHTAEAIRQQQKTVELDPNSWFSLLGLGFAYL